MNGVYSQVPNKWGGGIGKFLTILMNGGGGVKINGGVEYF